MLATQVLYSVEMGLLLLAGCVLVGPVVAEHLRIPGLVGLIAIGMVLGPSVLEWLRPGGFVATVGVAGLLYLMFLAGVELDLRTFVANRNAALTFGVLTFVVPFGLSYLVAVWYLDFGTSAAALVGAMWASHTVVAYPEAKAAGLDRNRAVGVAVAATIITDIAALVVLAVAASSAALEEEPATRASTEDPPLPLWVGLLLVSAFCLLVLPRLTKWTFAHLFHSRTQRFVWLLGGMAAGAVTGLLGGIEGLVGAFLAGIGMNRAVPTRGELMERVEFVGNAILVPAFLVSVGLAIDPAALVEPATLRKAAVFTGLVIVGKGVAAVIAGRIFRYSPAETAIMAALTIGQAAATLAIAQVGVATGLFADEIRDAAVVTVVATVLVTSFGTRLAARRIEVPSGGSGALGEHVVVHAPSIDLAAPMARLVTAIGQPDGGLATPFVAAVGTGDPAPTERLVALDRALTQLGLDTHAVTRVGATLAAATTSLAREVDASLVVLPVESPTFPLDLTAGGDIDSVGADAGVACMAVRLRSEPWRRIVVVTGRATDAARRHDLALVADVVRRLGRSVDGEVVVHAAEPSAGEAFRDVARASIRAYAPGSGEVLDQIGAGDVLVTPAHVVGDAGLVARLRLQRSLADVSVVVVAGPGRLRVSLGRPNRPLIGVVGQRASV